MRDHNAAPLNADRSRISHLYAVDALLSRSHIPVANKLIATKAIDRYSESV